MKRTSRTILIVTILSIALIALSVILVYARSWMIIEKHPYQSDTDEFLISADSATFNNYNTEFNGNKLFINRNHNANAIEYTAFDLLVFSNVDNLNISALSTPIKETISGGFCYIYRNVVYTGTTMTLELSASIQGKAVVLPYMEKNIFIKDEFTLKMLNNQDLYNQNSNSIYGHYSDFKNLYFIDNITLTLPLEINYAGIINLLYSNISTANDLTISHNLGGLYTIDSISGKILNTANVTINCPKAIYNMEQITPLINDNSKFTYSQSNGASPTIDVLLDYALTFANSYIPSEVYCDVLLPYAYHTYGINISYSSDNVMVFSNRGKVTRQQNTTQVNVTITASKDATTKTIVATPSIIGTSDNAVANNLSQIFSNFIGDKPINSKYEVGGFIRQFIRNSKIQSNFAITLDVPNYIYFDFGDGVQVFALNCNFSGGYTINGKDINSTIYICQKPYVVQDNAVQNITLSVGSAESKISKNVVTITKADNQEILERYIYNLYFTNVEDNLDLVNIKNDGVYRGVNKVIESNLDMQPSQNTDYRIFMIENSKVNTLTPEEVLQLWDNVQPNVNMTSKFSINNGTISPLLETDRIIDVPTGQTLIMIMRFSYDVSKQDNYFTYREVIIPSEGLGNIEFLIYKKGNTFEKYFKSLVDGMLINSTSETAYKFDVLPEDKPKKVRLRMSIKSETANLADFCTIQQIGGETGYWQIIIDPNKVPSANTNVTVTADFYIKNKKEKTLSIQNYHFMIPGIYRVGNGVGSHFHSQALYTHIVNAKDSQATPLYKSFDGYLLSDGASNKVDVFDLSLQAMQQDPIVAPLINAELANGNALDITGIEFLSNTKEIIFDNVKLDNLDAFNNLIAHNIEKLSFENCSLTDAIAQPLYNVNTITYINLSKNNFTSLPLLYRTVKIVNISYNQLNDISNVRTLINLEDIDLSHNKIALFDDLALLKTLVSVNVFDNTVVDFTHNSDNRLYYGTNGELNIPIYVALIGQKVNIYVDESNIPMSINEDKNIVQGDNYISKKEYELAVALNSIAYFVTQSGNSIAFPSKLYKNYHPKDPNNSIEVLDFYLIQLNYCINNGNVITGELGVDDNLIKFNTLPSDGELKIIVSISETNVTVFRQFKFNYTQGGTNV